jgi:hypothetical protein
MRKTRACGHTADADVRSRFAMHLTCDGSAPHRRRRKRGRIANAVESCRFCPHWRSVRTLPVTNDDRRGESCERSRPSAAWKRGLRGSLARNPASLPSLLPRCSAQGLVLNLLGHTHAVQINADPTSAPNSIGRSRGRRSVGLQASSDYFKQASSGRTETQTSPSASHRMTRRSPRREPGGAITKVMPPASA